MRAPFDPQVLLLLKDPVARANYREALKTSKPDPKDGSRLVKVKTSQGKEVSLRVLGSALGFA